MALVHEFLIKKDNIKISIDDNLIQYFIDCFEWIETKNPENEEVTGDKGLNYYGDTEIPLGSIGVLKNIAESILQLFSNAPNTIVLTGSYYEDETGHSGYEKIKYLREEILSQIEELYNLCIIAEKMKENIYHSGL